MKIQCDCGEWFEDSFIAEWGGVCSTCKAEADLKTQKKPVAEVPCSDGLSGIARAMELRSELFDIANSYAGEKTGQAAVMLHQACNHILYAEDFLNGNDR